MYNKCLFSCNDFDGLFEDGFVLDVPEGMVLYKDVVRHYSEFFKSEEFKEYISKALQLHITNVRIFIEKDHIIVNSCRYFVPRFITSFDKKEN